MRGTSAKAPPSGVTSGDAPRVWPMTPFFPAAARLGCATAAGCFGGGSMVPRNAAVFVVGFTTGSDLLEGHARGSSTSAVH